MTDKPLTILHSSDWHLGHTLMGRRRHDEFAHFLDWLNGAITEHGVDVLLVSGDIFDSSIPSNAAQSLYFDFLTKVWRAGVCRHIVVIAGNHDSPSLLNAPASLLKALNIHVVGCMTESIKDEVVVLYDRNDAPELVVGAIPYLRERDIRVIGENESAEDKDKQLIARTREHIRAVCDEALAQREKFATKPPIVVMGHLYSSGSSVAEGDGTRKLYVVGSLVEIGADAYSAGCDYVALGHIHVPQAVGGKDFIRYSGSPLPMGFHEDAQQKGVNLIRFAPERSIEQLPVPLYQRILSITGDREALLARVAELANSSDRVWLETIYDSTEPMGDLRDQLNKAVAGSHTEILCTKTARGQFHALHADVPGESLEDLTPEEVFNRCLDSHDVPAATRPALIDAYNEILQSRQEADTQAVEGVEA
ncbi:exonuclease SbcCD subunit D C-terminal domain-containing protein [Oligosphaera ethanolica]|uniref:Nuclease SbcCD subunit D n=1 Tax=Oligosphaera ethanolica TaxID=760260 RepID=A0AAE3VEF1_9BACT|nr:exonuclease SbcCD subunit D C-terminal domain-containing protein [Oligosphaera ethanolica]MDQ0288978.1 exonuclease SbcD [Oligosphaera ethanolica]